VCYNNYRETKTNFNQGDIHVKASELKKGDKVTLNNGWTAELRNNKKGNIRDAIVYGYATDYLMSVMLIVALISF